MVGLILVIDPVAINRVVLRSRIAQSCRGVIQAPDVAAGIEAAAGSLPELVLVGPGLSGEAACEAVEMLAQDIRFRGVPVLVLADRTDPELQLRALAAGAEDMLEPRMHRSFLLARIRRLLRQRSAFDELTTRTVHDRQAGLAEPYCGWEHPGHVVLINSQLRSCRSWSASLEPHLPHRLTCLPHVSALSNLPLDAEPDVFVIEDQPERPEDGLRLLAELKSRRDTGNAATILVCDPATTDTGRETRLATALDIGADEISRNGFCPSELTLRIGRQLIRKRNDDQLRNRVRDGLRQAVRDPLTGLYNRRYAMPHLERMVRRTAIDHTRMAVMMLDLDRFKSINDRWGHAAGDAVLVEVAARLRAQMRAQDLLARMGGEEFLVAMPDTDPQQAQMTAQRLCACIADQGIAVGAMTPALNVTTSIGMAFSPPTGVAYGAEPVTEMLKRADAALYEAKSGGRNCVNIDRTAA